MGSLVATIGAAAVIFTAGLGLVYVIRCVLVTFRHD